jgi:2-polyprenyl-3-methyl-5-hydroxy-6-metoxy-1,4-benzoquinol methylase
MAQMTNHKADTLPDKFYDELAADYDGMTGFEQRFPHERPFFRMLIERYKLTNALDAGCGTGFHSLLLAQLGLQVTATDISEEMLIQTRKHAKEYGLHIKTINSTFPELKKAVHNNFDSVFCLGNTCVHLLTEKELLDSLKNFYDMLNSEGLLLLQILNYSRILPQHERIQSIKEANGKMFVRFYDYENKLIRFNILTIEKSKERILHSLRSVKLRPWKAPDIIRLLRNAGFTDVKIFGSIAMGNYEAKTSKDVVLLARRKT